VLTVRRPLVESVVRAMEGNEQTFRASSVFRPKQGKPRLAQNFLP
jgi:hypothetical protein